MKNNNQEVWVGISDKTNDPEFLEAASKEFVELPIVDTLSKEEALDHGSNRRDFLKYLGFGLGAATLAAGCDVPVKRAIPYVTKPDEIVPGVATYYASSFVNGGDYCAILVKTREGRPIKIEGNPLSEVTKGGTNARTQACVLSLYDTNRIQGPGKIVANEMQSEKMSWADLDTAVAAKLTATSQIRIVTGTILSPTTKKAIGEFVAKFPNTKVVTYDAISSSAILEANQQSFGEKVIPDYRFDKAKVIVSVGADFLGTWISPIEYAADYAKNRKVAKSKGAKMSRHYQVESGMTMTGSNADHRILIKPSEQGAAIATLYNEVAAKTGGTSINAPKVNAKAAKQLSKVAADLVSAKGASLVVSGSNNVGEQNIVNAINSLLGNYGSTIGFANASMQRQGIDAEIQGLIREMNGGSVDAVFVMGANPAFDLPNSNAFQAAMAKVGTKVFFDGLMNETGSLCDFAAPTNHFLESWGDAEPKRGHLSLIQPTISPLFDTRQVEETLLRWAGSANLNKNADQPYYEYLKASWTTEVLGQQSGFASGQAFWDNALHDGVVKVNRASNEIVYAGDVAAAAGKINQPVAGDGVELALYETVNIGDGKYANNPWLQELPDPVLRTAWGTYLSVPISYDGKNYTTFRNVGDDNQKGRGEKLDVTRGDYTQRVTALPQFGQMPNTVSMSLGNGRQIVGQNGKKIGSDTFPYCSLDKNGNTQYYAAGVEVSNIVEKVSAIPLVQYFNTMGLTSGQKKDFNVDEDILAFQGSLTDRTVIRRTNLDKIEEFAHDLKEERSHHEHLNDQTLYPYEAYKKDFYDQGHHWGMFIDLNACVGCGACSVACMAENNVPVVGAEQVAAHHGMEWLRIDRYYFGDVENPSTVYQPMMCQHCDNAPCENVCPVAATNHSSEGLNQMTYNRCIGTRYCANNCPYKVRRFNWLDYTTADIFPGNQFPINGEELVHGADNLTRMVLNPDVTVRSRGVIEKCSFCVQRIQEGKLTAKSEGRKLNENDVKSACMTACPTGAITFGDTNDKKGRLAEKLDSDLNYIVLEEINVRSSVTYSAKVTNKDESVDAIS